MIFAVDHPLCDVWNQKKTQILIEFVDGTKKVQLVGKTNFLTRNKSYQRFRKFRTWFILMTTPYVMFEIKKKSNSYLILRWHKKSPANGQKKFPSFQKKVFYGLENFIHNFCCWPTPMWCLKSKKKKKKKLNFLLKA